MKRAVIFETDRLTIRLFKPEDASAFAEFSCDPVVREFFPRGALVRNDIPATLEKIITKYENPLGLGTWSVEDKTSREVIGHAALARLDKTEDVEIGYSLRTASWGRGFGTEIAKGLLRHGFSLGLKRLVAISDPRNLRSIAVLHKAGMTAVGDARYYEMDVVLFEIKSDDVRF